MIVQLKNMENEIRVLAFAKINIGLQVLRGTENGFHKIESIFQKIDLADVVHVQKQEGKSNCFVQCDAENLPCDNSIIKAYNAVEKVCDFDLPRLEVKIEKKIPSGGGLGGASSDAASFVFALEKMLLRKFSIAEKTGIASLVGSDVFFFLLCGNETAAFVSGRGENVLPFDARRDLFFVMVFPKVKCATKKSYELLDEWFQKNESGKRLSFFEMRSMYFEPVTKWKFTNEFTPALVRQYSEIGEALFALQKCDARFCAISGSGSTVYGIFSSEETAREACEKLRSDWQCCVASSDV